MQYKAELDRILTEEALSVAFQPIVSVEGDYFTTFALEALARGPKGSLLERPDQLFAEAKRQDRRVEIDHTCIRAILRAATAVPSHLYVSLNVHGTTLMTDPRLANFIGREAAAAGFPLERLVLEIVEYAPYLVQSVFLNNLRHLRDWGVQVAVDDIGSGDSNYRKIVECHPSFIKIDRYFGHGCHRDAYRQAVLESVALLARKTRARVIVEGIEDPTDFARIRRSGIGLIQGFLFSPPDSLAELEDNGLLSPTSHSVAAYLLSHTPPMQGPRTPANHSPGDFPMTKKVLLVDDTETVLFFEKTMLKGSGFTLRTAKDGEAAIEEVKRDPPDLILMDIMMPVLDGIAACRHLKADPKTRNIPIVIVTTKSEPQLVEDAFAAGCDDYITKPIDRTELLAKVQTLIA